MEMAEKIVVGINNLYLVRKNVNNVINNTTNNLSIFFNDGLRYSDNVTLVCQILTGWGAKAGAGELFAGELRPVLFSGLGLRNPLYIYLREIYFHIRGYTAIFKVT